MQHKRRKLSERTREVTDRRGHKRTEHREPEEQPAEPKGKRARNGSAEERKGIG